MINARGKIILANKQTRNLFGYDHEDLLGQPVEVLIPSALRDGHEAHRANYFLNPKQREMGADVELTAVHQDGHEFPVEISLSPLVTEAGTFATASIRDATARKQAQEQVSRLLEAAPDAMIVVNQQGSIALVNAQTERLFLYTREELIGHSVEVLVPERFRDQHKTHRRNYFVAPKVREMGAGRELSGLRQDGSEFPIEISLSPLQTETELLTIATVRDVSERKITEEKLRQYARSLEISNRELEQFAYVASHDLQAPLRNVVSYSQLLKRELPSLSDTAQQYFQYIETNATHMRDLIHDLLQFSRVNSARAAHKYIDINKAVQASLALLETEIKHHKAEVLVGDLPHIEADAGQLVQLFQNLIGNAIKFKRPGINPRVEIGSQTSASDSHVAIYVQDNGIGMDTEYQEKVFQIFTRLHSVEEYAGTGIGLAICKKIVENHSGDIRVEGGPDSGCRFVLTLSKVAPKNEIPSLQAEESPAIPTSANRDTDSEQSRDDNNPQDGPDNSHA